MHAEALFVRAPDKAQAMIVGIGIDVLHLSRLRGVIARRGAERLARRILAPGEVREFEAIGRKGGDGEGGAVDLQTRFLGNR